MLLFFIMGNSFFGMEKEPYSTYPTLLILLIFAIFAIFAILFILFIFRVVSPPSLFYPP